MSSLLFLVVNIMLLYIREDMEIYDLNLPHSATFYWTQPIKDTS